MQEFQKAYKGLNDRQRQAVDATEGPVMVVAGPGTGKTQLLAVRVANILQKNDTLLPTNILCLTFTEAGQAAMQRRLVEIMGKDGAHVAVHTFHSFGAEIINRYPQYFYGGLSYQPADPLTTHEILLDIFARLPHDNPLASQNQGEFVYLGSAKKLLAQLKKAAITPEELKDYARNGLAFVNYIEPALVELFDVPAFSTKADIVRAEKLASTAQAYTANEMQAPGAVSLSEVFSETFDEALAMAQETGKTKPLNDWKKNWYKKDKTGQPVCKQREVHEKLLAFADAYKAYRETLDERRLFDFDDMIGRVVHALETNQELVYDIQEQYQYFLVDEFQDTNAGQLRLLTALANHPVHEGRPNVMVVGDDDQAIFAFQGAELSNILTFEDSYRDVERIVLEENYRSQADILQASRAVMTQGVDRLETRKNISKQLIPRAKQHSTVRLERQLFGTQAEELWWVAQQIASRTHSGQKPEEIAVICREHKHLEALLPHLARLDIPVWYERQQDALAEPVVAQLLLLARVVNALSQEEYALAESLLPQLLAAPYWQVSPERLWRIGLASSRSYALTGAHQGWLEVLQASPADSQERRVATVLLSAAQMARSEPLETVLDVLLGNTTFSASDTPNETDEVSERDANHGPVSPFKQFYFSKKRLAQNPRAYNDALTALVALRNRVRQFTSDEQAGLADLIRFVDLAQSAGMKITSKPVLGSQASSVQLVTAHGSKGLEYETVFVLSAMGDVWDKTPRGDKLALPPNMLHIAHPAQADDNLRVLFVAMTRAKHQLIVTQHQYAEAGGKVAKPLAPLEHPEVQAVLPSQDEPTTVVSSLQDETNLLETSWHDTYFDLPRAELGVLLRDRLADYKLSVTHLHNFLDVTKGGPQYFLLGNLLRFPSAMSPSGAFGDAMHKVLQDIHVAVIENGKPPSLASATANFERLLTHKHLAKHDFQNYLKRGEKALQAFYETRTSVLASTQKPELDFYAQGVVLDQARLSGKLDLVELRDDGVYVTDYKTGKALGDWSEAKKSAYEKIKQHHYRQQLYFYKLLVDGSRDYGARGRKAVRGELVFVEPTKEGIETLELDLQDSEEIERLQRLIAVVWKRIQNLDFPETSGYDSSIEGIRQFEQDLLDGNV